jgi:starch synthase
MPRFGTVNERRHRLHEVVRLSGLNIIVDKEDYPLLIKVASLPNARLQVYFMDNEDYFKRKFLFRDEESRFFDDNAERAIFFCKSALEIVKKFGWPPHVIHCHGWMTSLIPMYLKTAYKREPVFGYSKSVFTAENDQFPEKLQDDFLKKAAISAEITNKDLELYKPGTNLALTVAACRYADAVIMSDENLHPEIVEQAKPSRVKKVVNYDSGWKEDVTPLLDLYKSFID